MLGVQSDSSYQFNTMTMAIMKLLVSLLMLITVEIFAVEEKLQVCEHDKLNITCEEGEIRIHFALYGRYNSKDCRDEQYQNYETRCASDISLEEVKERCENKSNCSVPAENSVFGDPCYGVYKYLEVKYSCYFIPPDCPESVVNVEGVTLTFPAAGRGEQANSIERCLSDSLNFNSSLGTRLCGEDSRWQEAELRDCPLSPDVALKQLAMMNITEQNVHEVAVNLVAVSNEVDDVTPTGLESLISALASVVEVGAASEQVTDSVVSVVDNVMALDEDTLVKTGNVSDVVLSLERQVELVHQNEQNYTESGAYVQVSALQLEKESLEGGITFDGHFILDVVNISDDKVKFRESSIRLPPSVVHIISNVHPDLSLVPITFITYLDARLFQPADEFNINQSTDTSLLSSYVDSQVITANIELDDVIIKGLPKSSSVFINFSSPTVRPEDIANNTTVEFVCVYWEYTETTGRGRWSQEGCTRVSSTKEEILCSCNHLTSFAVLVTVHDSTVVTKQFRLVLRALTVVGCILSIAGLSLSVLAMLVIRTFRQKQQTHVHLNLCIALLGLCLSFVLGINRVDPTWLCRIVSTLIYFFCLSSMAWMSVEAFYIYMLIWRYKRSSIRCLIPVAVLLAWGLPTISSLLVYFLLDKHGYTKEPDYCFLHQGNLLYFGFLLPIFLLLFYNTVVFTLATYRVSCRKIQFSNNEDKKDEIVTRVKSTFLFWILLGISWLFGFLVSIPGPLNFVVQIIFCFLFAFQGFFMFFMLFLQNPEAKRTFMSRIRKESNSTQIIKGTKSYNVKKGECSQDQSVDLQIIPVS
ncbi:Adhesion G protein-coupled receptor L2 [Holothuria leucospilota]|uniref:Adhesion G protein-coupled receptor L2 n=1 Tax=Holothuria leucospilota TaxID=206669 RepID=A0A9Q1CEC2_HOLLE|nr:Adhesion G protein-coupled receptor L2 [Holothuria leucospilota]